ncbi:MAG: hypothetical protein C0510_11600 [Erythrobacter sp.]|nr:hypothetical protein [Erythrobacter sp.]
MTDGRNLKALLRMTTSERAMGRLMKAPDHAAGDDDFAAFEAAGEVEVGKSNLDEQPEEKPAKKPAKPAAPPADEGDDDPDADEGDDDPDADEGDDDAGEGEGDDQKPKKTAKDHQIERLKREKADLARQLREGTNRELLERFERIEKGLSPANAGDKQEFREAPDPNDLETYPLGHLDPDYIEDKLEWLTEKKAADQADAVLQRQQEIEQTSVLLEKVDDLATRGSAIYEDFQESVVESGMRGDWDLSQATFEAAHEADNGAQILYELSQDKKEAARVARLTPFQQIKFVQQRDTEIGQSKKPRTKPRAGDPPQNPARGANSRVQINPATDDLDDFEKAWLADEKKSR